MSESVRQPIEGEIVASEPDTKKKKSAALAKRDNTALATTAPAPGSIEDLMVRAVEQGNMDVIERVFALSEKVKAEQARKAFFDAMSRFQSTVPKIPKSKRGYNYWYAPLGVIDAKIQKAMDAAGLSKKWTQVEGEGTVTMTCVVSHSDGHSESTSIGPVGWDLLEKTQQMNSLQHRAAVLTYLQRYTLIGALGISTADDDPDGVVPEDARAERDRQQQRPPVNQPKPKPTSQKKAAAPTGERPQMEPGTEDACIDVNTMKVVKSKMEHLALSTGDFKKRFPAFKDVEDPIASIKRTDMKIILGWLADPQGY